MAIYVAIVRRVREGREAEFQRGLLEFFQASLSFPGVLGAHLLLPPPGSGSREYGILRAFAGAAERDRFYAAPVFRAWLERSAPLTEGEPSYRTLTGLEAWFRSGSGPPPRWKMAAATLAGVYPTSLLLAATLGEALHAWPLAVRSLAMATAMVALLTWVVMPAVTQSLHGWLHPHEGR